MIISIGMKLYSLKIQNGQFLSRSETSMKKEIQVGMKIRCLKNKPPLKYGKIYQVKAILGHEIIVGHIEGVTEATTIKLEDIQTWWKKGFRVDLKEIEVLEDGSNA